MKKIIFILSFILVVSVAYSFNIVDEINNIFHINKNIAIEPNTRIVILINPNYDLITDTSSIIFDDITPNTTTYNLSISMLGSNNKRGR